MRVQLTRSGGFAVIPGLNRPQTLDDSELPRQKARQLRQLVRAANFFDLPDRVGVVAPGAADYFTYTLTVETDRLRKTIQVPEPIQDDEIGALISFVQREQ